MPLDDFEAFKNEAQWKGESRLNTIHSRLLFWFVLIAILPTLMISLGFIWVGYKNGRQQAIVRLESVAALKETEIDNWLDARQNDLIFIMNEAYGLDRIQNVLDLGWRVQYYDYYFKAVQYSLQRYVSNNPDLVDISLLDMGGRVILSTNEDQLGQDYGDQPFFMQGLQTSIAQYWVNQPGGEGAVLVSSTAITSAGDELLGVMICRAYSRRIVESLMEPTGMGSTGKAYLVNPDFTFLDGTNSSLSTSNNPINEVSTIHSEGIDNIIASHTSSTDVYMDYRQKRVIGVYRWMPKLQTALVVEQDLTESFAPIFTSLTVNFFVAFVTLIVAIGVSLLITRSIATPVDNLAKAAARITKGDINFSATIEHGDEIGFLAASFNRMTAQLRDLINSLEQRVEDRTHALSHRALQLETSANVSRQITSVLKIEELMNLIAELIRSSFGYYGVSIFLIDGAADKLLLHAFCGESPPSHRSQEINERNLNGKAALNNTAVLVKDVTLEANYLRDEHLPKTRSELVIPLRMGEEVIGTLDMISEKQDAFTPEDITLSQSLGDQIAIAIHNARLYEKSHQLAVMEERNRLARDLHDSVTQLLYSLGLLVEGWRQMATDGEPLLVEEILPRIAEINQQMLKEMRLLINELRPPILEEEGLLNALQMRLDDVENRVGVNARLITGEMVKLTPMIEDGLYRITLEALNNSLKYGQASQETVHLCCSQDQLVLEIVDNGKGFDPSASMRRRGGMGLKNMRDRSNLLGGRLEIVSKPGEGTTVRVSLPLAPFSDDIHKL
jgi:signal transduction histidine kinase